VTESRVHCPYKEVWIMKRAEKAPIYKVINVDGRYEREHRVRAEKALGKPLPPGARVHHVDGSTSGGPLVICQNQAYHRLLHRRQLALTTSGHANYEYCWYCRTWDAPEAMAIGYRKTGQVGKRWVNHRACRARYQRQRYAQRRDFVTRTRPGAP
jgi:hypothetical protein